MNVYHRNSVTTPGSSEPQGSAVVDGSGVKPGSNVAGPLRSSFSNREDTGVVNQAPVVLIATGKNNEQWRIENKKSMVRSDRSRPLKHEQQHEQHRRPLKQHSQGEKTMKEKIECPLLTAVVGVFKKRKLQQMDEIKIEECTANKKLKILKVKDKQKSNTNESDEINAYRSSSLSGNETDDELYTEYIKLSKPKQPDVKLKINDWFNLNTRKYSEDIITKGVNMKYFTGGEDIDAFIRIISLIENGTDNEQLLNTDNRNESQEFICPPLEWAHLVYLAIKNSTREFVTVYEIEKFVKRWFPFYLDKPVLNNICSALRRYDQCFTSCPNLNEKSVWTIHDDFIKIFEDETMFYVRNYENIIKSAMSNPDQLSILVKGYGLYYLGYDECMFG